MRAMLAFITEYEAPVSGRAATWSVMFPTDSHNCTLGQNMYGSSGELIALIWFCCEKWV